MRTVAASVLLLVSGFGVLAAHAGSVELGAIAADPPTGGLATVAWMLLTALALSSARPSRASSCPCMQS